MQHTAPLLHPPAAAAAASSWPVLAAPLALHQLCAANPTVPPSPARTCQQHTAQHITTHMLSTAQGWSQCSCYTACITTLLMLHGTCRQLPLPVCLTSNPPTPQVSNRVSRYGRQLSQRMHQAKPAGHTFQGHTAACAPRDLHTAPVTST
jgi:hypothetical protein